MAKDQEPVEQLSYKDLVTEKLNFWRNELMERTLKWDEAMIRFTINPTEVIKTQAGPMSLIAILEQRVQPVKEARACMQAAEKMLADLAISEETLTAHFQDDVLKVPESFGTPSPIKP